MSQKSKNQHYVPRFYLKNFTIEDKANQVFSFDKKEEKIFPSSINGIATENYFYESVNEARSIEKILAEGEREMSSSIKLLKKVKDPTQLPNDDKDMICAFVALQILRTREFRNQIKSVNHQIRKSLQTDSSGMNDRLREMLNMDDNIARKSQLRMFKYLPNFMSVISNKKWLIILNKTDKPYWTSDHPCYRFNPRDDGDSPTSKMGLGCRGIQIFLPITPKMTLGMIDPKDYSHYQSVIDTGNQKHIYFSNSLQVTCSNRFLFSSNKDFSLAKKFLDQNPKYKDPNRSRVAEGIT